MAYLNPRTLGMVMKNLCCILHPSGILNRHFPREAGIHGLWGFLDHPEPLALVSGGCLFVCLFYNLVCQITGFPPLKSLGCRNPVWQGHSEVLFPRYSTPREVHVCD